MGPSSEIRRTFRDPAKQRAFAEQGFTVIDLIPREDAAALADRFRALYAGDPEGFHSSLESADHAYRDRLHAELVATFGHLFDDVFDDHEIVMAQATVKWSGGDSTVDIHQDWSFVDESRFRTFNLWIPLVETSGANGALQVLPGSHVEHRKLRVHGGFPSWYDDPAWVLDPATFEQVDVRPGQAIVTDHALLHRSPPNRSDEARIAVVIVLKPVEATLYHWYLTGDDEIIRYEVRDPTFFRRVVAMQDPAGIFDGLPSEIVPFDRPRPTSAPPVTTASSSAGSTVATERRQARRKPFWRHLGRRPVGVADDR